MSGGLCVCVCVFGGGVLVANKVEDKDDTNVLSVSNTCIEHVLALHHVCAVKTLWRL